MLVSAYKILEELGFKTNHIHDKIKSNITQRYPQGQSPEYFASEQDQNIPGRKIFQANMDHLAYGHKKHHGSQWTQSKYEIYAEVVRLANFPMPLYTPNFFCGKYFLKNSFFESW